jgi:hypothetical protein
VFSSFQCRFCSPLRSGFRNIFIFNFFFHLRIGSAVQQGCFVGNNIYPVLPSLQSPPYGLSEEGFSNIYTSRASAGVYPCQHIKLLIIGDSLSHQKNNLGSDADEKSSVKNRIIILRCKSSEDIAYPWEESVTLLRSVASRQLAITKCLKNEVDGGAVRCCTVSKYSTCHIRLQ